MVRIFRKKAEASGAEIQIADIEAIPEEYRKLFTLNVPKEEDIWIYPHTKDLENALAAIIDHENLTPSQYNFSV